jgi:glutaredoxin
MTALRNAEQITQPIVEDSDLGQNVNIPYFIVFTNPGCMPCKLSMKMIKEKHRNPALIIDLSKHDWAHDYVTQTLGALSTPVVVAANIADPEAEDESHTGTYFWTGYVPDNIQAAAKLANTQLDTLSDDELQRINRAIVKANANDDRDALHVFYEEMAH